MRKDKQNCSTPYSKIFCSYENVYRKILKRGKTAYDIMLNRNKARLQNTVVVQLNYIKQYK